MTRILQIDTDEDYRAALARIDALMNAERGTPEGDELDALTDLVVSYEAAAYDGPDARPDATGGVSVSGVDGATGTGGGAVLSAAHVGDPCFYCNVPHDDVPIAACEGRTRYPWGHPYRLGRQQAMCGQSRLNPEFFRGEKDQAAYVAGYDGAPCP